MNTVNVKPSVTFVTPQQVRLNIHTQQPVVTFRIKHQLIEAHTINLNKTSFTVTALQQVLLNIDI